MCLKKNARKAKNLHKKDQHVYNICYELRSRAIKSQDNHDSSAIAMATIYKRNSKFGHIKIDCEADSSTERSKCIDNIILIRRINYGNHAQLECTLKLK